MIERKNYQQRLEALTPQAQCAFATACLERLLPAFEHRAGRSWGVPHNVVAMAWSSIEGTAISATRWMRIRAMLQRVRADIAYGPNNHTTTMVAANGIFLSEMFGYASSGDWRVDQKERARRASTISCNGTDILRALHRESKLLDPPVDFATSPDNEAAWQLAALAKLEQTNEALPTRQFFDDVEDAEMETGCGLDGSKAGWHPWERVPPTNGPDLTLYVATCTRTPKVVYRIWEASNEERAGAQVTGAEVVTLLECTRKDGVARFAYHVLDPALREWAHFLIYHLVAAEFRAHDLGDDCKEIRFRDLDTDVRTLVPYPPHSLADSD